MAAQPVSPPRPPSYGPQSESEMLQQQLKRKVQTQNAAAAAAAK